MSFLLPHFLAEGRGGSTPTSSGSTTRSGPTQTACPGWRSSPTRARSAASSRSPPPGTSRRTSPTTCCRWGTAANATTPTPTSSTTASGSASASRCCAPPESDSARPITDTRQVNPGEVWEENEFWIELSWRIDPDGSLGIRQYHESRDRPGGSSRSMSTTAGCSSNSVPGLPERAAADGLTPLAVDAPLRRVRDHLRAGRAALSRRCPRRTRGRRDVSPTGRVYTGAPEPLSPNIVPTGAPEPDEQGRRAGRGGGGRRRAPRLPHPVRAAGVLVLDARRLGLAGARAARLHQEPCPPGPAGRRPAGPAVHVPAADPDPHPVGELPSGSTSSRTPTRSGSIPLDAARLGVARTGDLVRVETEIGYFVAKAWITEGIRPGVVACSHHMGRWRLDGGPRGAGGMMATVDLRTARRLADAAAGRRRARMSRRTRTASGSGGVTPESTRTSPSLSTPTRSPGCTAGIRRCGYTRPAPATSTATSRWTPARPARSTWTG